MNITTKYPAKSTAQPSSARTNADQSLAPPGFQLARASSAAPAGYDVSTIASGSRLVSMSITASATAIAARYRKAGNAQVAPAHHAVRPNSAAVPPSTSG